MNIAQFFHVCRAAATVADVSEVTVFGAAAVVPWVDRASLDLDYWPSMELDMDLGTEELSTIVDGTLGELSLFHETHGVYAHGVSIQAFVAPPDWTVRAEVFSEPRTGVRIRTPHPLDLTIAKLVRGDEKDWDFAEYTVKGFSLEVAAIVAGLAAVATAQPRYAVQARAASSKAGLRLGPQ